MRVRPRMEKWSLDFSITIWDKNIKKEDISKILNYAGQFVGIGDYRPKFGRFIVTKLK
jgi:hypothetical protein